MGYTVRTGFATSLSLMICAKVTHATTKKTKRMMRNERKEAAEKIYEVPTL